MRIGDVDNDGDITIVDGILIKRALEGEIQLSDDQLRAADINGDGVVDQKDARAIAVWRVNGHTGYPRMGRPIDPASQVPVLATTAVLTTEPPRLLNTEAILQDGNPSVPFLGLVGWLGGAQFQQAFITVAFRLPLDIDATNLSYATFRFARSGINVAVKYGISGSLRDTAPARILYVEGGALTTELDVSNAIRPYLGRLVIFWLLPTGGFERSGTAGTSQFRAEFGLEIGTAPIVQVPPRPVLQAAFSNVPGSLPQSIQFSNRSTGPYSSSEWDFGDGSQSVEPSALHLYATPGRYTVSLRIYSGDVSSAISHAVDIAPRVIVPPPGPAVPLPRPPVPPPGPAVPLPRPPVPPPAATGNTGLLIRLAIVAVALSRKKE